MSELMKSYLFSRDHVKHNNQTNNCQHLVHSLYSILQSGKNKNHPYKTNIIYITPSPHHPITSSINPKNQIRPPSRRCQIPTRRRNPILNTFPLLWTIRIAQDTGIHIRRIRRFTGYFARFVGAYALQPEVVGAVGGYYLAWAWATADLHAFYVVFADDAGARDYFCVLGEVCGRGLGLGWD